MKKEPQIWNERISALAREMPTSTEDQIGWAIVREISARRATLLQTMFEDHRGRNRRLSIQTDPRLYRDTNAIVAQGVEFHALGSNMIVKVPVTAAGVQAIEELTYRGVSINATVSFTLPQCIQVAEAVERGLKKREAEGNEADPIVWTKNRQSLDGVAC